MLIGRQFELERFLPKGMIKFVQLQKAQKTEACTLDRVYAGF